MGKEKQRARHNEKNRGCAGDGDGNDDDGVVVEVKVEYITRCKWCWLDGHNRAVREPVREHRGCRGRAAS
jgi:hypothetical protein